MFWGESKNIVVALEIGTSKVAVAVGEIREDESLVLLGIGEHPSMQVRKGEIIDYEIAQQCVRDALDDAESKTDVEIRKVYLSVSGRKISASNIQVSTMIETEGHEIISEHLERLREMTYEHALPTGFVMIHDLLQNYILDGGRITMSPLNISSQKLTAKYHLVYGMETSLQTMVRCVKELSVDIESYALGSYATAQSVLTQKQKHLGAVVINCGAGVTEVIVYHKGAVIHTDVLSVGGDHITNDIVAAFKIPRRKAEELKCSEGAFVLQEEEKKDLIEIPGSFDVEPLKIYREDLVKVMRVRMQETLQILYEKMEKEVLWNDFEGTVYFSGGASQIEGLLDLGKQIFPVPVALADQLSFDGDQHYLHRPEFSTVLGLLQYAREKETKAVKNKGMIQGWGESFQKLFVS